LGNATKLRRCDVADERRGGHLSPADEARLIEAMGPMARGMQGYLAAEKARRDRETFTEVFAGLPPEDQKMVFAGLPPEEREILLAGLTPEQRDTFRERLGLTEAPEAPRGRLTPEQQAAVQDALLRASERAADALDRARGNDRSQRPKLHEHVRLGTQTGLDQTRSDTASAMEAGREAPGDTGREAGGDDGGIGF
jgi:hypothetical protein